MSIISIFAAASLAQTHLGGALGAIIECRFITNKKGGTCIADASARYPKVLQPLEEPGPPMVHPTLRSLRWTFGPERIFEALLMTVPKGEKKLTVDVGANRGSFGGMATERGHRAIAFEPFPQNIATLKALYPTVKLIAKGVGDKPAKVVMRGNSGGKSAGKGKKKFDVGAEVQLNGCDAKKVQCETIEITTLDAELQSAGPIFVMKMDIQGFETNAFRGGMQLLAHRRVDVFIIEFDPQLQARQYGSCLEIMLLLRGAGYVLFEGAVVKKGTYKPVPQSLGDTHAFADYVAELEKTRTYTDLVAVRYELVPRALVYNETKAKPTGKGLFGWF